MRRVLIVVALIVAAAVLGLWRTNGGVRQGLSRVVGASDNNAQGVTGDEFQHLSETFNTMLVNLKRNADQLRSINKSLDLKLGQMAESNLALYESNFSLDIMARRHIEYYESLLA